MHCTTDFELVDALLDGHDIVSYGWRSALDAGVPLAFAFVILLGLNGCLTLLLRKYGLMESFNLYSKSGLIVLYTYFQIPLGVLLLYPAFDALRADWRESAALLGAGPWRYWRHIGLPVLAPALMERYDLVPQGISADLIATIEGYDRAEVDRFAAQSHARAAAAELAPSLRGHHPRLRHPARGQEGTVLPVAGIAQVAQRHVR